MTESTNPTNDAQTFDDPQPSGVVHIGNIGLVPQPDGTGACLYFNVPGLCQINVMVSEEEIQKFIQARRALVGKRITLAKPYSVGRFPDLKKYR